MDGEEIYKVSPLTEGLLAVNGCWKSGKSFFFSDGATGKLPMPQFEKGKTKHSSIMLMQAAISKLSGS